MSQHRESIRNHQQNEWSQREKQHFDKYYPTRRSSQHFALKINDSSNHFQSGCHSNRTEETTFDKISIVKHNEGEQMAGVKFSFNEQFYQSEPATKLKDIHNTMQERRSASLVGSIKRNNTLKQLHQQDETQDIVDMDELENVRLSKLTELNERLNRALNNKENLSSNISSSLASTVKISRRDESTSIPQNQFGQTIITKLSSLPEISDKEQEQHLRPNPNHQLEKLFEYLDANKVGKLSRTNCRVKGISQQFKFIFGTIFTKIFLKTLICNKRQFIKLCSNVIKELDSSQVYELLGEPILEQIEPESNNILSELEQQSQIKVVSARSQSLQEIPQRRSSLGISESTIKEHKKSLREISDLTKRLSSALISQPVEHGSWREEGSLRFDTLVKFI